MSPWRGIGPRLDASINKPAWSRASVIPLIIVVAAIRSEYVSSRVRHDIIQATRIRLFSPAKLRYAEIEPFGGHDTSTTKHNRENHHG